jgi:hypothetical protein
MADKGTKMCMDMYRELGKSGVLEKSGVLNI